MQYNENNPSFPPPPIALAPSTDSHSGATIGQDDLAAMLEEGFDDRGASAQNGGPAYPPPASFPRSYSNSPLAQSQTTRYHLQDTVGSPNGYQNGFAGAHGRQSPPDNGYGYAKGRVSPNGQYVAIDQPSTPNMPTSGDSVSSSVESNRGHAKRRSGGAGQKERYGPLGPLADDDTGWGGRGGRV